MLTKLFSHTMVYGLASQVPRIASIFALPIITSHLAKLDFGVFGLITAISGSLAVLNTLGLNVVLSNSFFKSAGQYKWAWRQIYGFLILWNVMYALILAIILYLFIPKEAIANSGKIIVLNVLPIVFFGPTSVIGELYYQLKQQPFQIGIRTAITGLCNVALNIYFIAGLKWGYMGWFTAICVSQMAYHASYFIPLIYDIGIRPIFNFKWRYIASQLKIALPIIPHFYGAYLLDASDRVVMKIVGVNTENIGLYNAANLVGNFMQSGSGAASQAIGPMLLQAIRTKEENEAKKLVFALQIAFLSITLILSFWMKEIFVLLIRNRQLQSVYPLAIIITMAVNYRPMYLGVNARLLYAEKTKVLLKITLIGGVLNVAANMALIPLYGYQVAAYTTFLCLMYMGYSGFFLKQYKDHAVLNYFPIRWLTITVALTVIGYFAVETDLIVKIALTTLTVLGGLLILKKIAKTN